MLSIIACGEIYYQEDWLGEWFDVESDLWVTFHDNGLWSMVFYYEGIKLEIDIVGSYFVEEETYTLIWFSNDLFDVEGYTEIGTWKRKGEELLLTSSEEIATIYKKEERI